MFAKFAINIKGDNQRPERQVQVCVYENVAALRGAATKYDRKSQVNRKVAKGKSPYRDTLGLCHRFTWQGPNGEHRPLCAIVRLAKPYLGSDIVTHEIAHACQWLWELDYGHLSFTTPNDEPFAWLMGELTRQTVDQLYDSGVYSNHFLSRLSQIHELTAIGES